MNRRMISALFRWELVALAIPMLFIVLFFFVFELLLTQLGSGDPDSFPGAFWLLFGLVFGAGLIARERRLQTDRIIGTLPVATWKIHGVRFAMRCLMLTVVVLFLLFVKLPMDHLFYSRVLPYRHPEIALAVMAALAGLSFGAAVSSVARRESLALGGGIVSVSAGVFLILGIIWVHPEGRFMFQLFPDILLLIEGLLIPAAAVSIIRASGVRDPGSRLEFRRMVTPLLAAFVIGSVVFWMAPYNISEFPPEESQTLHSLRAVPGSDAVFLTGKARVNRVFLVDESGYTRLPRSAVRFEVSPSGRFIELLLLHPHDNLKDIRIQALNRDGGEIRSSYSGKISIQTGAWSPDERYFATVIKSVEDGNEAVLFLPSGERASPVEWFPTPPNRWNNGVLQVIGWQDAAHLICFFTPKLKDGSYGAMEIQRISPESKSGEIVWTGQLCLPRFFEWWSHRSIPFICHERNSLVMIRQDSPGAGAKLRLMEIFPDGRKPRIHVEIPRSAGHRIDHKGSRVCWTVDARDPDGSSYSELKLYDLNTMDSKTFRLPLISNPLLSPDGRFAAGILSDRTRPDCGRIVLVDVTTGQKQLLLEAVRDLAWTGPGRLAVLSHRGKEFGYLDPVTHRYTQRLALPRREVTNDIF